MLGDMLVGMAPQDGELIVEKLDTAWLLRLRGEHDLANSGTLVSEIDAIFAHGTKVVVDLTETTFLDSSILTALLRGHDRSREHEADALVVVAPTASWPRHVLETVKLGSKVPVYDDLDTALQALRS